MSFNYDLTLSWRSRYHIETSPLIFCSRPQVLVTLLIGSWIIIQTPAIPNEALETKGKNPLKLIGARNNWHLRLRFFFVFFWLLSPKFKNGWEACYIWSNVNATVILMQALFYLGQFRPVIKHCKVSKQFDHDCSFHHILFIVNEIWSRKYFLPVMCKLDYSIPESFKRLSDKFW